MSDGPNSVGIPARDTSYTVIRRDASSDRNRFVLKLHQMGIAAAVTPEGGIVGQVVLPTGDLDRIDGIAPTSRPRFSCIDFEHLRFDAPDPLARLDPISAADVDDMAVLAERIRTKWNELAAQTNRALERSRQLAPNAKLRLDPFRIEGTVRYGADMLTLLFSSRGHRACISAVGGQPVAFLPSAPRIILDATQGRPTQRDPVWDDAVAQATACLPPAPATPEEHEMSVDLASRDLGSLDLDSGDLPE